MLRYLYQGTDGLPEGAVRERAERLMPYAKRLRDIVAGGAYAEPESSLNLPTDKAALAAVEQAAGIVAGAGAKYVIVVGIGGSSLGAKAVYDLYSGAFDALEPQRFPKMYFAETADPEQLERLVRFIDSALERPEEVIVNIVSKSGTTTETVVNAEIIVGALKKKFGDATAGRVVVTTDEGSKLWVLAEKRGLAKLAIPKPVGGRYSVFSAVGLFPLLCAGIDIRALLDGARHVRDRSLGPDLFASEPALAAAVLAGQDAAGRHIHDTFVFHPELESFGRWYRQLLGESIGKAKDRSGETKHIGITPTVSVGSTDLHSVGQLYFEGPRDKFTTFVWTEKDSSSAATPSVPFLPGLVDNVTGRGAGEVMAAIRQGVRIAYQNTGLPFAEIVLEDLTPRTIGGLFQFKMLETMYLGELLHVDAFDQPGVEAYKMETRRVLRGD